MDKLFSPTPLNETRTSSDSATTINSVNPSTKRLHLTYWGLAAGASALTSHIWAGNFEAVTFQSRMMASVTFFLVAGALALGYCLLSKSINWRILVAAGFITCLMSDVAYSFVRQQIILIVFPATFCFSGVVFGGVMARLVNRRLDAVTVSG